MSLHRFFFILVKWHERMPKTEVGKTYAPAILMVMVKYAPQQNRLYQFPS